MLCNINNNTTPSLYHLCIRYSRACDARVAIAAMHKYRIADTTLEVGYLASAVNTALLSQMDNTTPDGSSMVSHGVVPMY